MRSPKLQKTRSASWYPYYAGYSTDFVEDILNEIGPGTVLDPWNGSGTTGAVAARHGVDSIGYDVNPALVVVARSRLVGHEAVDSLMPLAADVLSHATPLEDLAGDEPLRAWFGSEAAQRIRAIVRAVGQVLVERTDGRPCEPAVLDVTSPLASVFYVAVFETVRSLMSSLRGSNPTWVRALSSDPIVAKASDIDDAFVRALQRLAKHIRAQGPITARRASVRLGTSTHLTEASHSVGAVITSPPYATRIDYAVATRPELAVLDVTPEDFKALRRAMVGTPTVTADEIQPGDAWGPTASATLRRVAEHRSKASATYYSRYFAQYFDALAKSLAEIQRVVVPDGPVVLVVQDSYYKDVHIDLATIVEEMGAAAGYGKAERHVFVVATTKAAINVGARRWRSVFDARETVLTFNGAS